MLTHLFGFSLSLSLSYSPFFAFYFAFTIQMPSTVHTVDAAAVMLYLPSVVAHLSYQLRFGCIAGETKPTHSIQLMNRFYSSNRLQFNQSL